jgi:hypothetical protein
MARFDKPAPRRNPVVQQYHVYEPNLTSVGGTNVVQNGDDRTILLTPQAAQYLLDQGAIGMQRERELGDHSKKLLKQFRREAHKEDSNPEQHQSNPPLPNQAPEQRTRHTRTRHPE